MTRPQLEVADVFRSHGDAFLEKFGEAIAPEQRRALKDLARCRTAALGGHVEACDRCGHRQIAFNSCRNRHCPKCQATAAAQWMESQAAQLLPTSYFHLVFTLPATLGPIALQNPRVVYGLLFQAASQTLLQVAADPKHLGAGSASWRCSTPGVRTCTTIPTCTVSSRGADCRPMARAGSPVARASSCRCAS